MKGATGTQASFLSLFHGDAAKVNRLEQLVAEKVGMRWSYPVSGQTYSRKIDSQVVNVLSGFAQSASKFGYDMRLLQHLHEIEEPFEEEQVGSSAMAYKRNPMRAERIDALARHLIVNALNPAFTAATQWFERTLDDSANRRIAIPEAFLAADAIALIYDNIAAGLVVHEEVIAANVTRELPFMMTENLMMEGVRRGGDRQVLHERVRIHSQAAAGALKAGASGNDLFDRIAGDALFGIDRASIEAMAKPEAYTGLGDAANREVPGRGCRSHSRCRTRSDRIGRWRGAGMKRAVMAVALAMLAACAMRRHRSPEPVSAPASAAAQPQAMSAHGTAGWVGQEFSGRTTANGEIFDPMLMTAAHRTLPFGTLLDVRNPKTGQSVRVRVNDRGPYVGDRLIDLSYAAAQQIGLADSGGGEVDMAVVKVGRGDREPPAPFAVNVPESTSVAAIPPAPDAPQCSPIQPQLPRPSTACR